MTCPHMTVARIAVRWLIVCASAIAPAIAQDWPARPVRVIVPFTPGSATDIVGRAVADKLSGALGHTFLVENRPGAGGIIGANVVAKSDPDGYTILIHSSAHASNPAVYGTLAYDTFKDFINVTLLAGQPNVLVVSPTKGYKSLQDLVAAAKARPGFVSWASAGIGSGTHLNGEKFRLAADFEALHVPYKGTPEAVGDVVAGRVDFYFCPITAAIPLVKDGKLQALAVSSAQRSAALPNVPTTNEAGFPNSDYILWIGLYAPAGTPSGIVQKLHAETHKVLAAPDMKERLARLGAEPMPMTQAEFDAFMRAEVADAMRIAKAAGIKLN
jgi:tripartite-type tricarboxylate transporter receptor subunit TctC